ncbi:MAG: hypothetical protein JWR19_4314 [Pedosphaera sp.]|nr:hypothetical protein [Pedosphaera sp.]
MLVVQAGVASFWLLVVIEVKRNKFRAPFFPLARGEEEGWEDSSRVGVGLNDGFIYAVGIGLRK